MAITVNGYNVIEGSLDMPRLGAWQATLKVDVLTISKVQGPVTISIDRGALTLTGFVSTARSGEQVDSGYIRAVGGAGGLQNLSKPQYYGSTALKLPLSDLLTKAGETLSATSDATLLGTQLNSWTVIQQATGTAISALLQKVDSSAWRVLPDGSVWAGTETWPASSVSAQIVQANPGNGEYEIATESATLLPGTTLNGLQVSYVCHYLESEKQRTRFLVEP